MLVMSLVLWKEEGKLGMCGAGQRFLLSPIPANNTLGRMLSHHRRNRVVREAQGGTYQTNLQVMVVLLAEGPHLKTP